MNDRERESIKAAKVLRKMLTHNPQVPDTTGRQRREALELAISLLEARARDAEND